MPKVGPASWSVLTLRCVPPHKLRSGPAPNRRPSIIPRNLRPCRGTKGQQDGRYPFPNVGQTTTVGQSDHLPFRFGQGAVQAPQALGENDRAQPFARVLELVVDQHVVVLVIFFDLTAGRQQAALDHVLRILAAVAQAPLQSLAVGGKDEDADGVAQAALDLGCTLDVDVQQEIMSAATGIPQKLARSAIKVVVDFGMLQELSGPHHAVKLVACNEVILLAMLLAAAAGARGVGNREIKVRNKFQEFVREGRFTRTRGSRDDEDERFGRGGHSRFCTCSRDFSISAFMARPASVILRASPASPEVFESRVLASRFISCSRKSSRLPISPPSSSNPRKCWMWVSRRTISS